METIDWDWEKHVALLNDDRNRLPYWYPKVKDLVPTPKTGWVNVTFEDLDRTDTNSGKHNYEDTCYVRSEEKLEMNLAALLLDTYVKDLWPKAIVVREFVELDWRFKAFSGRLPIATEVRVMIRDGEVERWFFYWPEDAIRLPSTSNWREKLREMRKVAKEESETFLRMAEKVAAVFDGYWSVDFARTRDGKWMLIDMALGEVSWTPEKYSCTSTDNSNRDHNHNLSDIFDDILDKPVDERNEDLPECFGEYSHGLDCEFCQVSHECREESECEEG